MDNLICFFNFSKAWGGGEEQHLQLAREFKKRGINVILFVNKNRALEMKASSYGITTFSYHFSKLSFLSPYKIFLFNRYLKILHPKAIIINGSLELKFLALLSTKKTILIYRRGHPSPIEPNWLNRYLFSKLDIIITNSEFSLKSAFSKILPYCNSFPYIIRNGIAIDNISSIANYSSKSVLFVGRLEKEKDVAILIEAMLLVLKKYQRQS